MLHLITCHGRIMPRMVKLFFLKKIRLAVSSELRSVRVAEW